MGFFKMMAGAKPLRLQLAKIVGLIINIQVPILIYLREFLPDIVVFRSGNFLGCGGNLQQILFYNYRYKNNIQIHSY
jgi:hypothetical protein